MRLGVAKFKPGLEAGFFSLQDGSPGGEGGFARGSGPINHAAKRLRPSKSSPRHTFTELDVAVAETRRVPADRALRQGQRLVGAVDADDGAAGSHQLSACTRREQKQYQA